MYGGQTSVLIAANKLWIPDLTVKNGFNRVFLKISGFLNAVVDYTGTVSVVFPFNNIATRCEMEFSHFPFDKQSCPIVITSWSLSANILNISSNNSILTQNYIQNHEWDLKSLTILRSTQNERFSYALPNLHGPTGDVTFMVNIHRRPLYFMLTDIYPCYFLNLLTLITFSLPIPAQFGLSITVFLRFSFALVLVSKDTPVQGLTITPVSVYFIMSEGVALGAFGWFILENFMRIHSFMPLWLVRFCKLLRKMKKPKCGKIDPEKGGVEGSKNENSAIAESITENEVKQIKSKEIVQVILLQF